MFRQFTIRTIAGLWLSTLCLTGCTNHYHHAAKDWARSAEARLEQRVRQALAAQEQALTAIERMLNQSTQHSGTDATALRDGAHLAQLDFQRAVLSVRDAIALRDQEVQSATDDTASAVLASFEAVVSQLAATLGDEDACTSAPDDAENGLARARELADQSRRLAKDFLRS